MSHMCLHGDVCLSLEMHLLEGHSVYITGEEQERFQEGFQERVQERFQEGFQEGLQERFQELLRMPFLGGLDMSPLECFLRPRTELPVGGQTANVWSDHRL